MREKKKSPGSAAAKVNVFSFGVTPFEIASGRPAFDRSLTEYQLVSQLADAKSPDRLPFPAGFP